MIYTLISALTLMTKLGICIAVFALLIIAEIVAMAMLVKWKKNFKAVGVKQNADNAEASDESQKDEQAANPVEEQKEDASDNSEAETAEVKSDVKENSDEAEVKVEEVEAEDNVAVSADGEDVDDTNVADIQNVNEESVDSVSNNAEDSNVDNADDSQSEQDGEKKDDKWSAFAFAPLMLLSAAAKVTSVRYLLYALIGVAVVLGAAVLVTAIVFAKSLTKAPKQETKPEEQPEQTSQEAVEEQPEDVAQEPAVQEAEEEPVVDEPVVEQEQPEEELAEEPIAEEVAEESAEEQAEESAEEQVALEEDEVTVGVVDEVEEQPVEEAQPVEEVINESVVEEPKPVKAPVKREPVPREQTVVVDDKTVLIKDDRFLFNPEEDGWYYLLEKTFTAKLIQAEDYVKDYYTELKNELLSYKNVHVRMSKKRESFNFGRNCLVRMTIRGKTLRLHFALDAKDYEDTKYKIEDTSDVKSLADTPLMYRIKNERRLKYAKDLIAAVMEKFGVMKMPIDPIYYNYADDLPYETTPPLIERGLIIKRRVRGKMPEDKGFDFAKKTFKAKLIQSDEIVKEYYSQLKNHLLSYRKIHDRISKARESYRFGRVCVARMSIRGKTLKLYLALDANDYLESKYTIEDASSVKSVADTPLLIKIKNNRRLKHAMELIDQTMAKVGALKRLKVDETDYVADLPFEDTEELFEQGLIVNVHVKGNSFIGQRIAARQANSEAAADEDDNE